MAVKHLEDLEKRLERAHWVVVERFAGEDWRNAAWWRVARPDGSNAFRIDFLPDPEMDAQTILDSYVAKADVPGVEALGFAKGASWPEVLERFVNSIEGGESRR